MSKIEEKIVHLLKEKKEHISFAESMTGGMLASTIINVSGASDVIEKSFVTYSNNAKNEILNVSLDTISKYDVVSNEVTDEMAKGLYQLTKSDVCASVSGYANGYLDGKGLVCYSILYKNNITNNKVIIKGSRNKVRRNATNMVLNDIYNIIKGE